MASSSGTRRPLVAPAVVDRVCRLSLFPLLLGLWVSSLAAIALEVVHGRYLLAALALPIAESEWSARRGVAAVLGIVVVTRAVLGVWVGDLAYVALSAVAAPAFALAADLCQRRRPLRGIMGR
jgi:hypothetical protein